MLNEKGGIMGVGRVKNESKDQNIFEHIPSVYDAMHLDEAMNTATCCAPQSMQITFRHQDIQTDFSCLICKLHSGRFLLKGWRIPKKKLAYFPLPVPYI